MLGRTVWYCVRNLCFCSFVLSHTASRTACLGEGAALFPRPFESRPTDSFRREVFRQVAVGCKNPWFEPVAVPQAAVSVLPPVQEPSGGSVPPKRRRAHR